METRIVNKLKGFNHWWHVAHQYSLTQLPFVDWTYLIQHKREFSNNVRGDFDKKIDFVPYYEPGKYDFALLHLDQQCVEESLLDRGKGSLYRELNGVIDDIPKIVIMHGTPYYPEKFGTNQDPTGRSEVVKRVKELVGENTMVTNSKQCAKDFGFGTPIIHGLDADEWWDLPKEPRVVTMISPGGLDKYYDRTFLEAVREELAERDIYHCHITVDWRSKDWDDYRNFIGRSLVYFNPAKDSPMPRSRTEAMLSGCCVLTTPHQDADDFIKDGENGFIVPRNPKYVADKIEWCFNNYKEAVAIGQKGKETAKEIFTVERYNNDWKGLLEKTLNVKIEE